MQRTLISGFLLFSLFVAFLAGVQFSTPNLVDNDGYYHIKMAYLMRTEGLKPEFDWLPLTVLNPDEFVDHHFLFHVLLIPFTYGDLRVGAKLASVIFTAFAFLGIWWLLYWQKAPLAWLWAAGLLVISEAFIYRMSMPRAQSISLGVLALGLHWCFTRKYAWLAILSFLYVWLYNAFPLLLALSILYSVACLVIERRLVWKPIAFTALGIVMGLVLNPYFPDNLLFLFRHLSPKLVETTAVRVGSEWYPYNTIQLLDNSGLALAAFAAGVFALGFSGRRMDTATATALLASFLFGVMLLKSRRFVEYFPPFSLIFTSLAWKPALQDWIERAPILWGNSILNQGEGHRWWVSALNWFTPKRLVVCAGLLLFIPAAGANLVASRASLHSLSLPYERYAAASTWLRNNTPAGARVFQTDWDDFPRLFFYNTHNTYTIGLDPTYMQLYDAALFNRWVDITQGKESQLSKVVPTEFGASYILTDLHHVDFLRQARRDHGWIEIYRDEYAAIFRLKSP